ncbi:peptide deformylase [Marinilabiliaceae bacterium JC017]|nr:peptide deformylase [Marinilabiliaceae bacterium JC017]
MIQPITAYGHPVLRKKSVDISDITEEPIKTLIENMWETMRHSEGVGLAAPQVHKNLNLFTVDTKQVYDNMNEEDRLELFPDNKGIKTTLMNARIVERSEEAWVDMEGCLSIPGLSEEVKRPWSITVEYTNDENERLRETYSGYTARVIQHEYDHIEGILYTDHLSSLKKRFIKRKLIQISAGKLRTPYKMIFP